MMDNVNVSKDIGSTRAGIRLTRGEKVFGVVNAIVLGMLALIMIYPFWHQLMYSLSQKEYAMSGGIFLWPRALTFHTYAAVFKNPAVWLGFRVSFIVTITGTVLGTALTATTAYPISKGRLRGRVLFISMIFFTMLFNGGLVPNYLLIKDLRLIDSLWALILPGLLSAWNIFIMRNFFAAIPESLEESARIDGASDFTIFFRIVIPLSKAVLATIALFIAVGYWNDFFSTILYITKSRDKWSLQAVLRDMLTKTSDAMARAGIQVNMPSNNLSAETVKAATVIVATTPILIVYPFLQKYFVKGVMIGSIKG